VHNVSLLERLAVAIESHRFPGVGFPFAGGERSLAQVLDSRDQPEFEVPWLAAFNALELAAPFASLPAVSRAAVDRVREATYMQAFHTTGSPELAAYVSDDFDLLSRAILIAHENAWLTALFSAYQRGVFPAGHFPLASGSLVSTVDAAV
jgi:hypothetical protein